MIKRLVHSFGSLEIFNKDWHASQLSQQLSLSDAHMKEMVGWIPGFSSMYLFAALGQLRLIALGVHEFDVWCMVAGLIQFWPFHITARLRILLVSHVMPKPWIKGQSLENYFSSSFSALSTNKGGGLF